MRDRELELQAAVAVLASFVKRWQLPVNEREAREMARAVLDATREQVPDPVYQAAQDVLRHGASSHPDWVSVPAETVGLLRRSLEGQPLPVLVTDEMVGVFQAQAGIAERHLGDEYVRRALKVALNVRS